MFTVCLPKTPERIVLICLLQKPVFCNPTTRWSHISQSVHKL